MKINNINNVNNINKLNNYKNIENKEQNKLESTTKNNTDKVNISKEAHILSNVDYKDLKREVKIENIKKLVLEDNYNVNPEKLADKIISFEKLFN
jgi:flagellar biosynthesis anti-sigma factor FlgM